jgi:hypothetical protein
MLRTISAFVETPFYVVAVALVIFVAVFWFALKHERSLLLPFTRGACCCHSREEPAAAIHRFNRARYSNAEMTAHPWLYFIHPDAIKRPQTSLL